MKIIYTVEGCAYGDSEVETIIAFEEEADAYGFISEPEKVAILAGIDLNIWDEDTFGVSAINLVEANSL